MSRRPSLLLVAIALASLSVLWWLRGTPEPEPPQGAGARASSPQRAAPAAKGPADPRPAGDPSLSARQRIERAAGGSLADAPVPPAGVDLDAEREPDNWKQEELDAMIRTATLDPDPIARAGAVSDLSLEDDLIAVLPAIQQAAADPDPDVKLAVVEALGRLGEAAPIDLLTRFLNDPDAEIRLATLDAVENLSEEDSVPALVAPLLQKATQDRDEEVREKARDIIARLADAGDAAADAEPSDEE